MMPPNNIYQLKDMTMKQMKQMKHQDTRSIRRSYDVVRNVRIAGHRTSLKLAPEIWDALGEIASWENLSIDRIVTIVSYARPSNTTIAGAIRIFILAYYRGLAKEYAGGRSLLRQGGNVIYINGTGVFSRRRNGAL